MSYPPVTMIRAGLSSLTLFVVGCGAALQPCPTPPADGAEAVLASEPPPSREVTPSGPLAELSWLAGEWWSWDPERSRCTVELWMTPAGTSMFGASRTVAAGQTVGWEHIRIEAREEGLVYVARPSGQEEAEFRLTDSGGSDEAARFAVFDNPEHDFPVRIRYSRRGDVLTARIEGRQPDQGAEWELRRAAQSPCPAD